MHSFIPSAQQNQVDIQLDYDENIPLEVEGDPFRLNQILFNLIKNAIKFGKNGRVIVSIKLVSIEVNQAKIRFNVIDNGIGIASVEVDKIFKSFSHANEAIMENYGGSGIGLSIIKNLLVLMNSEIQLKSEPGKGSLFYFELDMPISRTPDQEKSAKSTPILIVDDNKINRIILGLYLDVLNIKVEEVSTGNEAIEACKKQDYRIVFMDLQMPEMDGIEATRIIRENHPNSNMVIFAVSASSKDTMKQ